MEHGGQVPEDKPATRDADVFDGDEFLRLLGVYARAADDPMQTEADHYQALEGVRAFCRAQIAVVEERAENKAQEKLRVAEQLIEFHEATITGLQSQVEAARQATIERIERGLITALSGLSGDRG
jgi:hypothetical protein